MMYWESIADKKTLCACGHKKGDHHYIRLVGDNSGKCLIRRCECTLSEGEL